MRFTVSCEQLKFFRIHGYLEVEDFLDEKEVLRLMAEIAAVRTKSPGYPAENLFRSIPFISYLIKKKGWGEISAELLHKKPLRLFYDKFFTSPPSLTDTLDDNSCGVIIELTTRKGYFFKQLANELYNTSGSWYFLVFTSKFLPNQLNPVIVK